jgi:hypothetical protein
VRNYNLFPIGKGFALLVYTYLVWNLCGILGLPLLLYYLTKSVPDTLFAILVFQAVLVWPPVLYAAWRHGRLIKAVTSLPAFVIVPYVNSIIYVRSLWKECIIGDSLRVWHKGH